MQLKNNVISWYADLSLFLLVNHSIYGFIATDQNASEELQIIAVKIRVHMTVNHKVLSIFIEIDYNSFYLQISSLVQ